MNYGDRLLDRLKVDRLVPKIKWEMRKAVAPIISPHVALHHAPPFQLWGEQYDYYISPHNMTWRNERAVELAIASRFVAAHSGDGMEFGNVLVHYGRPATTTVVDKYEVGPGVMNVDIVDYAPTHPFDYIVSISTLEHVGWDEKPRDPAKAALAFTRLVAMLAPGGTMLITTPTGHNPGLDQALLESQWPITRLATLLRTDKRANLWSQSENLEVRPYAIADGRGADAIWVIEVEAPTT